MHNVLVVVLGRTQAKREKKKISCEQEKVSLSENEKWK